MSKKKLANLGMSKNFLDIQKKSVGRAIFASNWVFWLIYCNLRITGLWFLYQRNLWSLKSITDTQNMTLRWFLAILELLKAKLWSQRLSKRSCLDFLDIPKFRFWEWFFAYNRYFWAIMLRSTHRVGMILILCCSLDSRNYTDIKIMAQWCVEMKISQETWNFRSQPA